MNSCSYGISLAVSCNGFNSVIVSARVPYSWMFCRICLCTAYPTKHSRILHPCRHYDTIKTIKY